MVFHWGDSKSPQISRTLLNILANLNNTLIWNFQFFQTFFQTFGNRSKRSNNNHYYRHPHGPHLFKVLLQRPTVCLSFHFLLFSFCGPPERQNPPDGNFFFLLINTVVFRPWLGESIRISKSPRIFRVSFFWTDSGLCKYHLLVRSSFNLLHNS